MAKQITRNQHYISRFILRKFAKNEKDLFEFLIPKDVVYPGNPEYVMTENHTYEYPEIQRNTIEDLFASIEGVIAPQFEELENEIKMTDENAGEISGIKVKVEQLYKFFILSYYRSGALLAEYSTSRKDYRIPLMTQKIADIAYLDRLAQTMRRGYNFAFLKSNNDFLLSDQCVSTVALKAKSNFFGVSNRNIGLQETLILVPISSSYYIALWYSKDSFGIKPNTINCVDGKILHLINRAILNNSYLKCVAQKRERLEEVKGEFKRAYPSQVFAGGGPDGYSMGAVGKKEVFLMDVEREADKLSDLSWNELFKKSRTYDPCPCDSGKKYKWCHKEAFERAKEIIKTYDGPYPFGDWRQFVIPGVPEIERPIHEWAGFAE